MNRQFPFNYLFPFLFPGYQPRPPYTPPFNPVQPIYPINPGQQFPSFPPFSPTVPGGSQAPTTPPPSFVPQKPEFSVAAVDPGGISNCMFRFVYIWLENGQSFWAFPVFVGPRSISGFRWTGWSWVYFGIDLRLIDYYQCY